MFWNDKVENGGKGLLISADVDFLSFEQGIEDAELLMEKLHEIQELYNDLKNYGFAKQAVQDAMDGGITPFEENLLTSQYGAELYNKILKELTEQGADTGNVINPARTKATNFTTSDVGWGKGTSTEPQPVEIDFTGMTASVQKGSQEANRDVVDGLAAVVLGLQRLLGKEWNINITPSAALGRTVGQSQRDLDRVTGYNG